MSLEEEIASLNEWHFFAEFVYSATTFSPTPQQELELADNLVWLGDIVLAFQLKERGFIDLTTPDTERRWFQKKVLGRGTRQVRDTISYLEGNNSIGLKNRRGHAFELQRSTIRKLHKLVVYLPHADLPEDCRRIKNHTSSTAGLIHVISGNDYLGIVRTLLTPAEVADYLEFRERILTAYSSESYLVCEAALVGQYLAGQHSAPPSADYMSYIRSLEHRAEEWDMSGIITRFSERTTSTTGPTDYYPIIRELALLKRSELREFKLRYQLALKKARSDEFAKPYRMAVPRTGCGFVIIPITKDLLPKRQVGLTNLTVAHKYEQKLSKCVGVVIGDDLGPWFLADWCYIEEPWEHDAEMEQFISEAKPFRSVRQLELSSYSFSLDDLEHE